MTENYWPPPHDFDAAQHGSATQFYWLPSQDLDAVQHGSAPQFYWPPSHDFEADPHGSAAQFCLKSLYDIPYRPVYIDIEGPDDDGAQKPEVINVRETRRSRGFRFEGINGQTLDGRNITVNEAQTRSSGGRGGSFSRSGGGRYGGGHHQGGGGYGVHRECRYGSGSYGGHCDGGYGDGSKYSRGGGGFDGIRRNYVKKDLI